MPVLMPWADAVQAIIYAWLPGQAMGEALADVLLGAAEPGGRLPVTLPAAEADCPVLAAVPDADGALRYAEGLLIGYRGYDASGVAPRYPFGHGLGYTTWAYESLAAAGTGPRPRPRPDGPGPQHRVPAGPRGGPGLRGRAAGRAGRPVRVLAAFASAVAGPGCAGRGHAAAAGPGVRPLGRAGGRLDLARRPVRGPGRALGARPAADGAGAADRLTASYGLAGRS